MSATIITMEDLNSFKTELLHHIEKIVQGSALKHPAKKWLKSKEVRQLLNISPGTLQTLRINGTLSYTRIGSIIYYSQDDINAILEQNKNWFQPY